jgi:serine/threonine-protein kinase
MNPRGPSSSPWSFGDYEVLSLHAQYDLCPVYRGRHLVTQREVAIKFLPSELVARVPAARERFLHQVQLLARISHHSVVAVFEVGELDDGTCYLVGELVEGEPLSRHLRAGPLPVMRALRFGRQLAVGLRCVHEAGAIVRDVKPSIVMLVGDDHDPDGYRLKIVDLSLAEFRNGEMDGWAQPSRGALRDAQRAAAVHRQVRVRPDRGAPESAAPVAARDG